MVEYRDNQLRGRDRNEQEIIDELRKEGLAVYAINPLSGSKGHPDLMVYCGGKAYPVEVKIGIHDQSKLSAIQCYFGVECYFVVAGYISGAPYLADQIKLHACGEQSEWLGKQGYIGFLYENQIKNATVESELRKRSSALRERQTAIDIGINLNASHDPHEYLREYREKFENAVSRGKRAEQDGNYCKAGYAFREAQKSARCVTKYLKHDYVDKSQKWKKLASDWGKRADRCWEKYRTHYR